MRQRLRSSLAAAVLAAVVIALTACSGGTSDQAKVKTVVKAFLDDVANGRGTQACDALTGDAVRYVSQVGAVAGSSVSCPDAVHTLSGLFSADEKKALTSASIGPVTVSGSDATIQHQDIKIDYQGQSHLWPGSTASPVHLVKTDAGWKISSLG
jgi:hypothetical protein